MDDKADEKRPEDRHILVVDDVRDAMQAGMNAHAAKPVQQVLDGRKEKERNAV